MDKNIKKVKEYIYAFLSFSVSLLFKMCIGIIEIVLKLCVCVYT